MISFAVYLSILKLITVVISVLLTHFAWNAVNKDVQIFFLVTCTHYHHIELSEMVMISIEISENKSSTKFEIHRIGQVFKLSERLITTE